MTDSTWLINGVRVRKPRVTIAERLFSFIVIRRLCTEVRLSGEFEQFLVQGLTRLSPSRCTINVIAWRSIEAWFRGSFLQTHTRLGRR